MAESINTLSQYLLSMQCTGMEYDCDSLSQGENKVMGDHKWSVNISLFIAGF